MGVQEVGGWFNLKTSGELTERQRIYLYLAVRVMVGRREGKESYISSPSGSGTMEDNDEWQGVQSRRRVLRRLFHA